MDKSMRCLYRVGKGRCKRTAEPYSNYCWQHSPSGRRSTKRKVAKKKTAKKAAKRKKTVKKKR